MFGLECSTGIAPSNVLSRPLRLETGPLLLQEAGQAGHKRPEAHDGGGAQHLVSSSGLSIW
jgi:hypothetical protein